MTATIEETTIEETIDLPEVEQLTLEHWEEVAKNKKLMVLKPNKRRYRALEAAGLVIALVARDAAGKIIGYSVNFLGTHLHYEDLTVATNDILFVHRDHRNSRLGLQLIRETERLAKERGARMVMWHAKEGTALCAIMPRLGYGVQDIIYSREV